MSEAVQVVAKTPVKNKETQSQKVKKPELRQSLDSHLENILFLQRTIGNQAVAKLISGASITGQLLMRMSISMSSGNQVTDTNPANTDNIREEVLALLDRLHTMWSITNDNYNNQYTYVSSLAPGAQVPQRDPTPPQAAGVTAPWSFQPTIDAISRNNHPSLAAPVIRRYMGVPVSDGVGRGSRNIREDVLTVMNRLNFLSAYSAYTSEKSTVTGLAASSLVPDSSITGTLSAITGFKQRLAAGTLGIRPMHSDELEYGGADRFAAQTAVISGDTVSVTFAGESASRSFQKHFSVFVPRGALPDRNKLHLFFTPFLEPEEFVAQQGLRAQFDRTDWILIGVPALGENDIPNFITISTAEITRCLTTAGRSTTIDAIRISSHSRGYRGFINTIGRGRSRPLIDLGLIQSVTAFDSSYATLGATLRSRQSALTGMQDPAHPTRFAAGSIRFYDVTVPNVSGLPGIRLDESLIRGLAYVRLVQEGLARGDVSLSNLSTLTSRTRTATNHLMTVIPQRGAFSTRTPTPPGMINLAGFLLANRDELKIVDHPSNGLKLFIRSFRLDWGVDYSRLIDAHHWFVTELAHEAVM
jgi:hypothetical protein